MAMSTVAGALASWVQAMRSYWASVRPCEVKLNELEALVEEAQAVRVGQRDTWRVESSFQCPFMFQQIVLSPEEADSNLNEAKQKHQTVVNNATVPVCTQDKVIQR